jgi:hypothetical protein
VKTKKFKKLKFSKETIANLNINHMRLIHSGDFQQGQDVEITVLPTPPPLISTDTCSGCTTTKISILT